MKKIHSLTIWILLTLVFGFISCDNDNENIKGTTSVEIRLTDAPAQYDAVNINIQSVALHVNSDWIELNLLKTGIYNLLELQNGVDVLLANEDVPIGKISQIRLILGNEGNSVVKDGQRYELETPSAQQSGLKLNLHDELVSNIVYRLWIDFDATRSIVETGSGKFQLKPVIRTYTDATSGSIKGFVLPQEANAIVWAILGTDSVLAHPRLNDGYFLISGLQPSHSWKVVFEADKASGYKDHELSEISVVTEQVNDLGNITLTKE
ncbi:DUF4382 domain-containing protein [Dysgonomonas sp. Marseille-P4677]|uniref:DUF4382 domain-containing protein n=1 Tax=Dysgonomonas sp. Marseille-P4677 TaxID=2364790 RepID=UPI00191438C8|nr:DUF4382 domain-containing protein [Dysgonomonas sp. Marseille-P4677]MBK5719528.1 DUF4382 domain-containing protein [Dysgonomonas sp. Marseille-P4677]